ncbi:hypothetical protein PJF56_19160 [Roseofilum sp. BLCC_M91]|uniref:Uncharacterized protein n=1 Tax=Roseofilum halophilum BLCC-M91 TaxID=3022259 RepID=A0ABT7BRS5_9CYAN|nr:hypothetical protein [Roseofilum halophilum]MDJ1180983.1 hypothetical protein [Roseofilum halophilum BLCC-M91]
MTQTNDTQVPDSDNVQSFTLKLSHDLNLNLEFLDRPQSPTEEFSTVQEGSLMPLFVDDIGSSRRINIACDTSCK